MRNDIQIVINMVEDYAAEHGCDYGQAIEDLEFDGPNGSSGPTEEEKQVLYDHFSRVREDSEPKLKVLIIVPHYWGRGDTIDEAWQEVKNASYSNLRSLKSGPHKIVVGYDVGDAKLYVNEMGALCYPAETTYHVIHAHKTEDAS